MTVP
jgi:hypothetical protein